MKCFTIEEWNRKIRWIAQAVKTDEFKNDVPKVTGLASGLQLAVDAKNKGKKRNKIW